MKKRIAINGFGRIGRLLFRQLFDNPLVEVVAVNDLADLENLAYLLSYDTVYGRFGKKVETKNGSLIVDGKEIKALSEQNPEKLPWGDLNIDIAVEATGVFASYEKAKAHLEAGAKRVIITAPAKDQDNKENKTILMGVNTEEMQGCSITSNGSCTTNAVAGVIRILHDAVGVEKAALMTSHGYTASQSLVDGPTRGSDKRKGRAAAQNMIPSSTGAAIAVTRAVKDLENNFDGIALRIPVVSGSIADITFVASRETSVEEINEALKKASEDNRWKGIIAVTNDQIVSSDIIGDPHGAIVDLALTRVIGGNLVKVMSWYDNEWGYVATMVKHVEEMATFV